MLYFDHNATAPLVPQAREAWLAATERFIGNPSSPHRAGSRADHALNEAREALAAMLGCHALDLVWTSGATESNNLVFHHLAATLKPDAEVWVGAAEHPCVLEAARTRFGPRCRLIPVSREGVVELDWLREHLAESQPGLVAVMAANNETGVLQPWREALALCRERDVPFFSDAVQWIGKQPARGLGECDFLSGSAHKFGGPRGVGFLKVPARTRIVPLLRGGPQEDGRRAGTENVPGVMATLAALEARERLLAAGEAGRRADWRAGFERALLEKLPGTLILGAGAPRLWNTVAALMPARDGCERQGRWVVKLDKLGCAVSTGSACSSGKEHPSHVATAMRYSPAEAARMLRFSSGWDTTEEDWTRLLDYLETAGAALGQRDAMANSESIR